ncbi:hypothetical protein FCV25MIE_34225 [Fagus crenata]
MVTNVESIMLTSEPVSRVSKGWTAKDLQAFSAASGEKQLLANKYLLELHNKDDRGNQCFIIETKYSARSSRNGTKLTLCNRDANWLSVQENPSKIEDFEFVYRCYNYKLRYSLDVGWVTGWATRLISLVRAWERATRAPRAQQ